MSYIPSSDQIQAQLRIAIPAIATLVTVLGVPQAEADSYKQTLLLAAAPLSYFIIAVWTAFANTRAAYMRRAAKPARPGLAPPQIILPPEEKALADKLPDNVTSSAPH